MRNKTSEMFGMQLTKLMTQDECAPDSREWFDKEMKEEYGFDVSELKEGATFSAPDELTMIWINGEYLLMYNGDDPWYKLYHIDRILPLNS